MKIHKMFCIDQELAKELVNVNASGLVNDLLTKHFNKEDITKMTTEQLKKKLKITKATMKYDKELEEANAND